MKKYFTSTSNPLSFSNQLFKYFRKTANSFRVGMSFLIPVLAMMLVSGGAWGQTATNGDYRSIATGNWGGATTWQVRSSGSWVATSIAPTSINNVYIQTGHTVTVNTTTVACNDLQLHTSGVLAIGVNIAQVNGKIRAYTGTAVTTAGADGAFYTQTSSTSPNANNITSSGVGVLSIVGNSRTVYNTGEWGATTTGFALDVSITSGQTATAATSVKAANVTVTSGTLDMGSSFTLSADNGTTGGNITVANGATLISARSGAGSAVFQRTGTTLANLLTVNPTGTLQLNGTSPAPAMTTNTLSGTVIYGASGTQTTWTTPSGTSQSGAATLSTFNNLTLSGTSAKTLGVNTTVNGALTITGTASNAYGAFTLGFGSSATATVNTGGSLLLNTGSYGASTNSLILNPNQIVTPALSITSGNTVIWAGTTALSADSRIEANGSTGSLTLSGIATGSGSIFKQAAGTLTFSNVSNNLTGGTQIGNGTLIVNSGSSMGTGSLTMFQTITNNTALTLNNTAQTVSSLSSSFTATTGTQTQVITLGAGHTLTINQSTNTTYGSGAVSTLISTLAGSGNLTKSGTGTLTLTSANTYTGTSKISNGKLDLGIANALSSSTNIIIDGGILGTSTGFTQAVGTLNLNSTGNIALGASSHTLTFAPSNVETWNGTTLTITGWTGTAGASGTAGKIFVGSNSTGLTSTQLAKISFSGFNGTATILSTGEIVPTAPTPTITGTATATPFTTTYGTASASQTFSISGSNLTADLIATAPTGFEVSSDGTTYGSTATFTQSGGSASGSLRIRLAANATVTGSYNSQNIVLSSTGATAVNITMASSGNIVSAKPLNINGITAGNKVYDGNITATVLGTPAYVGLVNSETFSVTGTPTASFTTTTVGTGKTVTVAGYTAPSSNYAVSQPTGLTADITTKSLTINGITADGKVYDGNTTAILSGTPAYVGLVNGETFSVTGTPTAIFTTASVGVGKLVTVTGYTAPSTNYSITQPSLTANITAKPLTVTGATAANKIYDGNANTTISGITLSGVINSDDVSVSGNGTFSSASVANGISVTTSLVLSGTDAGNYSLTQPIGLTANITPKPLTIIGLTANDKVFDGNTTATLSGTATLNGVISGDEANVTLTGTPTATFVQSTPGNSIAVTITGYSLTGSASGNYSVSQPAGLTANITNSPTPVINSALTATATYGVVSTSYFITATNSPTSFNATGLPTGLSINTSTGEISGTPTAVAGSPFSVSISATNNGGTGTATLVYTITPKTLTVSSPSVSNKVYDKTNTAIITGTLLGIVNSDVVNFNGTGTFSQVTVGSNLVVTSTSTLSGTDAAKYSLIQPTGLTADITTKSLTITGLIANDKVFDGNTTATLSGTAVLNGVISGDEANVTLTGTPIATFAQSAVGTGIVVTVTGYSLTGSASGNYSVSQPAGLTANITNSPTPVINSALTATATYGVVSTSYFITATNSPTSFNATGLPTGLSINTSTGEISGTPTAVAGSPFSVSISATNNGGTGTATLVYTITPKTLTVSSPSVSNKVYDKTNTAIITGTLLGIVNSDVVNFNGTGTFSQVTVGSNLVVTSTSTLSGTDAAKYSLTQPTGLTADITTKSLTITGLTANDKVFDGNTTATLSATATLNGVVETDNVTLMETPVVNFDNRNIGTAKPVTITGTGYSLTGSASGNYSVTQPTGLTANITALALTVTNPVAQNKIFDGNTSATITGTLTGVISPDVVTFIGTGTFASSAVGNGIVVTPTSTLGGAGAGNYTLTQSTGLTANITIPPTLTEIILPQYIQGINGTNANRIPFAFRLTLSNLNANATYRYFNGVIIANDISTSNGAGNIIFPSAGTWVRSSGPSFSSAGNYGEFTTDGTGSYSGWFITEPSGNVTRFLPGNDVFMRINLNNGAGGTTVVTRLTTTNSVKVINTVASAGANNGTGLRGNSGATAKNFVFVYDNETGTGRPLSGTFVESDGTANTTTNSYSSFYGTSVDGVSGAYGLIIPNTNSNGVRRIEQRDFTTGAIAGCVATDNDGVWTSGANTVNPIGGTTAIAISLTDAPLNTCVVTNTAPTIAIDVTTTSNYVDGGIAVSPAGSFATSGVLSDPTDPAKNFGIDFTVNDAETAVGSLTVTATSSNVTVLPNTNLNLTGSGASRNLKITPNAEGFTNITVSVNDGVAISSFTVNYGSSNASINPSQTRFHTGTSDASTTQMIDNNLMIVGDDENQALRLYNRQNSGLPVNSFDFTTSFGLTDASAGGVLREVDIEASAKVGNRIYWMGSHSNSSGGSNRPNRSRFFATDIAGTGNTTTLSYVGRYDNLKTELLAWDANNGHGLGANYLGLTASSAAGKIPETADGSGFNIEGFEIAPNNTTAYICFRAPLQTTTTRTKALIIPLTNFANLVSANPTSTTATFGNPIQLDLGGRAIREMKKNASGEYLIIAGPHDGSTGIAPKDFRFYTWTGNPTDAPMLRSANLTALNVNGSFESIVDLPSPLVANSNLQVLVDNGDAVFYGDGTIAKELPQNNHKKFRSELVNLGIAETPLTIIKSIITGNWESTTTWDLGRIPQAGDLVIIDQNHEVTLNGNGTAKKVQYLGSGKLKLNSISSTLKTGL